jgi:hypothetical protein
MEPQNFEQGISNIEGKKLHNSTFLVRYSIFIRHFFGGFNSLESLAFARCPCSGLESLSYYNSSWTLRSRYLAFMR